MFHRSARLLVLALSAIAAISRLAPAQDAAGSVQGRVLFDGGDAPKDLKATEVVVYLVGDGLKRPPADPHASVLLDQRDITFQPHVVVVQVGQKLVVHNGDAIVHNIHTRGSKNSERNEAQPGGSDTEFVFERPEVVPVGCDIHSQMSAWVIVVDNPFHAMAGADGRFTIQGVPPGSWKIVAWHEKYGRVNSTVEVQAGQTNQAEINLTKAPQQK